MATGDASVDSVNGMVWLAGLAPGVLGFQWQVSPSLWSNLLDTDPHGMLAVTLRRGRQDAGAAASGALVMLDQGQAGFRRIAVDPGIYHGDFGWLCGSGELLLLATVGPAAPPPARPADDPSLVLIHPAGAICPAPAPRRLEAGAPPMVRLRAHRTFPRVRLAPAHIATARAPAETMATGAGPVQAFWAARSRPEHQPPIAPEMRGDAWRASGAHSLPPDVGWPEPGPRKPAGAA